MTQTQLDSTQYKPAGSATQVQFNGSGSMSASSNFTFDGTTLSVTQLKVTSIAAGFVPPVVTTAQKNAIVSPALGSIVYDSTLNLLQEWNGSAWTNVAPSATPAGGSSDLQYNNGGVFGGAAGITTDGTNLTMGTGGSVVLTTPLLNGTGGSLTLTTGNNTNPTNGGGITLTCGLSDSLETSGSILITTTNGGNGGANGGSITLTTGSGAGNNQGGSLTLTSGSASGVSSGGSISLTSATPANGGNIILTGTGANGTIAAPAHGNIFANYLNIGLESQSGGGIVISTEDTVSSSFANVGGNLTLTTGISNSGGVQNTGGSITLTTGASTNGNVPVVGGGITLTSGSTGGGDSGGSITLTSFTASKGGNLVLTGTGAGHGTISANSLTLVTPLAVSSGGTGTTTPGLIAGTNITSITGSWPNQTINAANQTTSPAGSNTQLQFNNSGAFGASASLTWTGTVLDVTGTLGTTVISTSGDIAGGNVLVTGNLNLESNGSVVNLTAVTGAGAVALQGPSSFTSGGYTFRLPPAVPVSTGLFLTSDTSGNTSWTSTPGVTGSGTTNSIPVWTSSSALGNSGITDNGNGNTLVVSSRLFEISYPGNTLNPTSEYQLFLTNGTVRAYTYENYFNQFTFASNTTIATIGDGFNASADLLVFGNGFSGNTRSFVDKVVVCCNGNTASAVTYATTSTGSPIARTYTATSSGGTITLSLQMSGNAAIYQVAVLMTSLWAQ